MWCQTQRDTETKSLLSKSSCIIMRVSLCLACAAMGLGVKQNIWQTLIVKYELIRPNESTETRQSQSNWPLELRKTLQCKTTKRFTIMVIWHYFESNIKIIIVHLIIDLFIPKCIMLSTKILSSHYFFNWW